MNRPGIVLILVALVLTELARAATFTVNRTDLDEVDADPGDGICAVNALDVVPQCTLRAAIMEANALPGADTILIPSGTLIELARSGQGGAEVGDLAIDDHLSILALVGETPVDHERLATIDASRIGDRVFRIAPGLEVRVQGLRLRGGRANSVGAKGGAVLSYGALIVEHSIFVDNQAAVGGAIYSTGASSHLRVVEAHFANNRITLADGAAVSLKIGAGEILRSSFLDNFATGSTGSSVFAAAPILIENSTLHGASSAAGPRGAAVGVRVAVPHDVRIRNSTITGFSGHALDLTNLDGHAQVRVAHSILADGVSACRARGADPAAANMVIAHSVLQSQDGCAGFLTRSLALTPQLGTLASVGMGITWYRPPAGPFANVVNAGMDLGAALEDPGIDCSPVDQRGEPRPRDGNGSGWPRCDIGAIELDESEWLTVGRR